MKLSSALPLLAALFVATAPAGALAQDGTVPTAADSAAVEAAQASLDYDDYTVKAYSLTVFGGSFSGATYLQLNQVGPKTVVTPGVGDNLGPGDVLGFDDHPLAIARARDQDGALLWDAPEKRIESGPAFGARIGVYISDNFHLDIVGTYATGKAVTSMLYLGEDQLQRGLVSNTRYELDDPVTFAPGSDPAVEELKGADPDFQMMKGGLALFYDAQPAKFWGIVPRLGFGLGGIINRFTELEDKTSLYLEGSLALTHRFGQRLDLVAQADVTNFAFQVDELGYANMVNYATFSLGLSWMIDVLPGDVRAKHEAVGSR